MKIRRLSALLLIALGSRGAMACLNDRDSDTLANQGKQLPDVVRVISGRFERNPPLYYQMRIARVAGELKLHPERLALYDDIAVANDRLGRDDAAIAWMNRKKARLAKSSTRSAADTEALYRYYANNGTFWAHRWLHAGANRAKIGEIKTARNLIAQAIQIKPNAHFGREKYQLMTMDWIIDPRTKDYDGKPQIVSLDERISPMFTYNNDSQATGLSGLIVLGNAWESVDIFHALSEALRTSGKSTLQYLAILRCRELIKNGKKSLRPDSAKGAALQEQLSISGAYFSYVGSGLQVNVQNQAAIETVYKRLRSEAEAWQTRRTSYMMARLKTGKHPDTDKTFWRDWHDTKPPSLDVAWYSEREAKRRNNPLKKASAWFFTFVPLSLVLAGTLLLLRRKRLRS